MTNDPFAAFWSLFPRKVAKLAAIKAWSRLAPDAALVEQIMAGLRAQLPYMLKKDKEFIPYPGTWIHQQRWADEGQGYGLMQALRVIDCAKCGDTGVYQEETLFCGACKAEIVSWRWEGECPGCGNGTMQNKAQLERCSCSRGQLPGLAVGPIHAEDAL